MPATPTKSEISTTEGVQPRTTQQGLVVNGPQRWPWYDEPRKATDHDDD